LATKVAEKPGFSWEIQRALRGQGSLREEEKKEIGDSVEIE
jgi:hypothetical protein